MRLSVNFLPSIAFTSTAIDNAAEENTNDQKSSSIATYYSKIVGLGKSANDLNVKLSGIFPSAISKVQVFARVSGSSNQNIEEQNFVELKPIEGGYNISKRR